MATMLTQPKAVAPGAFEQELIKLDQGVQSELPGTVSLTINGVSAKAGAIDTTLQNWITIFQAVDSAKATYQNAVAARLAVTAAAKQYVKALKAVIKAYFGPQSVQLASFGIAIDKPVVRTAEQKLVSAAKATQTRAVRGTLGRKQKAKVTVVGNPPVLVPSTGKKQISPPPVNVGNLGGTGSNASSAASSTPSSAPTGTAAPSVPAPAGSASGSTGTPGSTPAAS